MVTCQFNKKVNYVSIFQSLPKSSHLEQRSFFQHFLWTCRLQQGVKVMVALVIFMIDEKQIRQMSPISASLCSSLLPFNRRFLIFLVGGSCVLSVLQLMHFWLLLFIFANDLLNKHSCFVGHLGLPFALTSSRNVKWNHPWEVVGNFSWVCTASTEGLLMVWITGVLIVLLSFPLNCSLPRTIFNFKSSNQTSLNAGILKAFKTEEMKWCLLESE